MWRQKRLPFLLQTCLDQARPRRVAEEVRDMAHGRRVLHSRQTEFSKLGRPLEERHARRDLAGYAKSACTGWRLYDLRAFSS